MSLPCFAVFLIFVFSCAYCMPSQPPVNEDYIGRSISCTPQEKLCFKYGRVLNQDDGKCYPMEKQGPCPENYLYFLEKDAVLEYGKFVGKCVFNDEWPKPWFAEKEDETYVLVSDECKSIERNIFGEYVCLHDVPSKKEVQISQPEEEGQCIVPNLLNVSHVQPLLYSNVYEVIYSSPCSISEYQCLQDKKIYWPQNGQCYDPLVRGPCAEGELLLLDEEQIFMLDSTVVPVCRPTPCTTGQVLMDFDKKCYSETDVLTVFCPKARFVVTNVFGRSGCEDNVNTRTYGDLQFFNDSGTCYIFRKQFEAAGHAASKSCSPSNLSACPLEVKLSSNIPIFG